MGSYWTLRSVSLGSDNWTMKIFISVWSVYLSYYSFICSLNEIAVELWFTVEWLRIDVPLMTCNYIQK